MLRSSHSYMIDMLKLYKCTYNLIPNQEPN